MKTSLKVVIAIFSALLSIEVGYLTGRAIGFGVDLYHVFHPGQFNEKKEGGFLYTVDYETYCVRKDFQTKHLAKDNYESDPFVTYTYVYNEETKQNEIQKEGVSVEGFDTLRAALAKKDDIFLNGNIYLVNDKETFVWSKNFYDSALFYFNGDFQYVTDFPNYPLEKIKILEHFGE